MVRTADFLSANRSSILRGIIIYTRIVYGNLVAKLRYLIKWDTQSIQLGYFVIRSGDKSPNSEPEDFKTEKCIVAHFGSNAKRSEMKHFQIPVVFNWMPKASGRGLHLQLGSFGTRSDDEIIQLRSNI